MRLLVVGHPARGRELNFALAKAGHEVLPLGGATAYAGLMANQDLAKGLDAVILGGTWHQLTGKIAAGSVDNTPFPVAIARDAESRGIVPIWWYGSNGCPYLSYNPDPLQRKAEHDKYVGWISERQFIAVLAPYCVDTYEQSGVPRDKMRVVPTLFDSDLFHVPNAAERAGRQRLCHEWNLPVGKFWLGTIGNTPNSKGGDDTLRAMALLKDEMPDLHYFIHHSPEKALTTRKAVGPDGHIGNSEADVLRLSKELAVRLGLKDRVHFRGMRVERRFMPWSYRMMDVYCSPSKAENLGQPLIESQLCGLPLVTYKGFSFDFCACPHSTTQYEPSGTVTDDWGLVIPETNPEDLAEAIRKARNLAETPGMAEITHAWAAETFDHRNVTKMIAAIEEYRSLLNG